MRSTLIPAVLLASSAFLQAHAAPQAKANAEKSAQAIRFCRRYARGWLSHADPASGLLPRRLNSDAYWNAKDCAADNFPFLLLTACVTDDYYLKAAAHHILEREQRLTSRVDSLPDDFLFATQSFRTPAPDMDALVFGAAEYAKDGLMPVTERLGPGPWLDRMVALVRDVWKHSSYQTEAGLLPSLDAEVNGDLLQAVSRLYWITGEQDFRTWSFLLADYYLLHQNITEWESLRLDDHGCEIISGLSEAYVIASREDPGRRARYRGPLHAVLDTVLDYGVNEDGFVYEVIDPRTGEVRANALSDNWGYNYNALLTVALIDGVQRYREAVRRVLEKLPAYLDYPWEGGGADGYADSIEGALNLLNRFPVEPAFEWVDRSMGLLFAKQRPDGIIEGWYGDGNSARTALMYALWKTQGVAAAPWRDDVLLGAVLTDDGTLEIHLESAWDWSGRLRFDRPRHAHHLHLPLDYARINQFPEWFTVEPEVTYQLRGIGEAPITVTGGELLDFPVSLEAGRPLRLTLSKPKETTMLRKCRYAARTPEEAAAWQRDLRARLARLLRLPGPRDRGLPLDPVLIESDDRGDYILREMELRSAPGRRIPVLLALPEQRPGRLPAVVAIHGHGGTRHSVFDSTSIYKGFAAELAARGAVVIAADVGQHHVQGPRRTLMGQRLWDLIRCVDYVASMPEVDASRIGCAGLSLGGEMAMWLAAMDERIAATVSSGFLTVMDQLEQNHCMCWKLNGLRELVDFADIYSLIAPRPLQCQNGLREPPSQFPVALAERALAEISTIYRDLGSEANVTLQVHEGGHEIDLPSLLAFFQARLMTPDG